MRFRLPDEGNLALVVSPRRAQQMLDCGETRLTELVKSGDVKSYKDGKSRKITVASIHAYIERKLAEATAARAA